MQKDEMESKLIEVAELAADAVASDGAGELSGYLLGRESFNRLIDLLVELGQLPDAYLREKTELTERKETKRVETRFGPPVRRGDYWISTGYQAEVPIDDES